MPTEWEQSDGGRLYAMGQLVAEILSAIESSVQVSMGSPRSHYCPQISKATVARWRAERDKLRGGNDAPANQDVAPR